jgi:hypothetical protein
LKVQAIYGIVVPTGSEFSQADADAMAPAPHIVSDAFAGTGAPPFPRLEFDDGLEVVMVTVSGQTHDVLPALRLPRDRGRGPACEHPMSRDDDPEASEREDLVSAGVSQRYELDAGPAGHPSKHPDEFTPAHDGKCSRYTTSSVVTALSAGSRGAPWASSSSRRSEERRSEERRSRVVEAARSIRSLWEA